MKTLYLSYIRAFIKFAQTTLDKQTILKTLSSYALVISRKADELLRRASINEHIDMPKLRKEIYELGIIYIHKFSDRFIHQNRS